MKKELPKEIFPTYLNLTSILERFDNDTFSSFNQIEKHLESFVEKLSQILEDSFALQSRKESVLIYKIVNIMMFSARKSFALALFGKYRLLFQAYECKERCLFYLPLQIILLTGLIIITWISLRQKVIIIPCLQSKIRRFQILSI